MQGQFPRPAAARGGRRRRRRHPAAAARTRACRPPPDDEAPAGDEASDEPPSRGRRRRASFRRICLARGAVFRRRHRLLRAARAVRRPHRSRQGLRGADRVLQQLRQGGRRRDAGADGRQADGAARGAVHPLRRAAVGSRAVQALEAATVVVCPSPYESLSLLALEALSVGTPVLANARSAVLVEHCVRSNGGLYYADRDEFVECLKLLVGDAASARRAGPQRPRLRRAATTAGTSCSASTSGSSRRSGTRGSACATFRRAPAPAASAGATPRGGLGGGRARGSLVAVRPAASGAAGCRTA